MKFSDVRIVECGILVEPELTAVTLCIVCDESIIDIVLSKQEIAEMLAELQRISPIPPVTP